MKLLGSKHSAFGALADRRRGRSLMQKRAPTLANILVIVLFALSCFGLLLFLWESFGGPVPLKPKGYRFTAASGARSRSPNSPTCASAASTSATSSASQHDKDGLTHATDRNRRQVRADPVRSTPAAPEDDAGRDLPADPAGGPRSRRWPTAASSPRPGRAVGHARRHPRHARPRTRAPSRSGMRSLAVGLNGRGEQINSGFAEPTP